MDSKVNEIDEHTSKIENEEAAHFVTESNWYDLVNRISQFTSLPFTMEKVDLASVVGEQVIMNQLDQLVGNVLSSATHQVSRTVRSISNQVVEILGKSTMKTEEDFRDSLQKANEFVGHLIQSCGHPSPTLSVSSLTDLLNATLFDILEDGQGIQDNLVHLMKQGQILEIFSDLSEESGKIEGCAVLRNLGSIQEFCDSNLQWSAYVNESVSSILQTFELQRAENATRAKSRGVAFITAENQDAVLMTLEEISGVSRPTADATGLTESFRRFLNNRLQVLQDHIRATFLHHLSSATTSLLKSYAKRLDKFGTLEELEKELKRTRDFMTDGETNDVMTLNAVQIVNKFTAVLGEFGLRYSIANDDIQQGRMLTGMMDHIGRQVEGFSDIDLRATDSMFKKISKYVRDTAGWYSFLKFLNEKMSALEVQSNRSSVGVLALLHWGVSGNPKGPKFVRQENCRQFLDAASNYFKYDDPNTTPAGLCATANMTDSFLGKLPPTPVYNNSIVPMPEKLAIHRPLQHVGEVLTRTFTQPECRMEGKAVTVTGPHVTLSEALKCIQPIVSRLTVISTTQVYVDVDVNVLGINNNHLFDLIIISPTWNIVGNRTISLKGKEGMSFTQAGSNGEHGNPGVPGGNGGNFIGFGDSVYGGYLLVDTSGGKGGPGQNGAIGHVGRNGIFCDPSCLVTWHLPYCKYHRIHQIHVQSRHGHKLERHDDMRAWFLFDGTPGAAGGRGGDGGAGGIGGNPGTNKFFLSGSTSKNHEGRIQLRHEFGLVGEQGRGGPGGEGGWRNQVRYLFVDQSYRRPVEMWVAVLTFGILQDNFQCRATNQYMGESKRWREKTGTAGNNGANWMNRLRPESLNFNQDSISPQLGEFHRLAGKHIDVFTRSRANQFSRSLRGNTNLKRSSLPLTLAEELHQMELGACEAAQPIDLPLQYEKFLEDVDTVIKFDQSSSNSASTSLALKILKAVALGRKRTLTAQILSSVAADISAYIGNEEIFISSVGAGGENFGSVSAIRPSLQFYRSEADAKLQKIQKSVLSPIVSGANGGEFSRATPKQSRIPTFAARTIKALANLGAILHDQLVNQVNSEKSENNISKNSSPVSENTILATEVLHEGDKLLREFLNATAQVQSVVQALPVYFQNVSDYADTVQIELGERHIVNAFINSRLNPFHALLTLADTEVRLNQVHLSFLHRLQEVMRSTEGKPAVQKQVDPIVVQARGLLITTVVHHSASRGSMAGKQLETFAKEVQPSVKGIGGSLNAVLNYLESNGTGSNIASGCGLRSLATSLRKHVQNFAAVTRTSVFQEDKGLEDVLLTLTDLFESLEDLQDEICFFHLTSEISSAPASSILQQHLMKLQYTMQANAILQRQKIITDSLAAAIFPFGPSLRCSLSPLELTTEKLTSENGVKQLLTETQQRVTDMAILAENIKDNIPVISTYQLEASFNPELPFYKWDNGTFGDAISGLLEGQWVHLFAHVDYSPSGRDVIKFQSISIEFSVRSEGDVGWGLQQRMENQLRAYSVVMTHIGNSYFRWDEQIYAFPMATTQFERSFQTGSDALPIQSNEAYQKLISSYPTLSPYTLWELKLKRIDGTNDFASLGEFKGMVDMLLVGQGTYLAPETSRIELGNCQMQVTPLDAAMLYSQLA